MTGNVEEVKKYVDTQIALLKRHIELDEPWEHDQINGRFTAGRLVIEREQLKVLETIWEQL